MPAKPTTHLAAHRQRLKDRGIVRVEVRVKRGDESLVKRVAEALNDPASRDSTLSALQKALAPAAPVDLKALLASAPLEGVELRRDSDLPREVDL